MDDKVKLELELAVKNFNKGLADANKRIDNFSKNFQGGTKKSSIAWGSFIGNIAAIGTTAAIRAIGATAKALKDLGLETIKLASDAEEIQNKFDVTFRGIGREAEKMAQDLARNYGLAKSEARDLLASTGDLLTGFGFSRREALNLSTEVQKLSADLASFHNIQGGAAEASERLTRGLLGETESLKSMGIVVNETLIKEEILKMAKEGLTYETLQQAKAQAVLRIAMRQSANSIGDFARSQDSYANQTRILNNRIKDLKEGIGAVLLPVATAAKRAFNDLLGSMDVSTVQKFVANGIKKVLAGLKYMVDYANPVIKVMTKIGQVWVVLKNISDTWRSAVITAFLKVGQAIISFVDSAVNYARKFEAVIPQSVLDGLEFFQEQLGTAEKKLESLAKTSGEKTKKEFEQFKAALVELTKPLKNFFTDEQLKTALARIDQLALAVENAGRRMKNAIDSDNDGVPDIWSFDSGKIKKEQKNMMSDNKIFLKKMIGIYKSGEGNITEAKEKELDTRVEVTNESLGRIASMTQSSNRELFEIGKAAAIAQATIDGASGVMKAWKLGPIIGPPMAALVAAATAVQIQKISETKFNAAEGGIVPGSSYTGDRVQANLNSGEAVLNRPQQSELLRLANGGGVGNNSEIVNAINNLGMRIQNMEIRLYTTDVEIARSASRGVQDGVKIGETR